MGPRLDRWGQLSWGPPAVLDGMKSGWLAASDQTHGGPNSGLWESKLASQPMHRLRAPRHPPHPRSCLQGQGGWRVGDALLAPRFTRLFLRRWVHVLGVLPLMAHTTALPGYTSPFGFRHDKRSRNFWEPGALHFDHVFARMPCSASTCGDGVCLPMYREALSCASPAVPCGHMEESEAHNGAWLH